MVVLAVAPLIARSQESYSGIYPHLAFFNEENECGTGAIVPWADRLWVITYAPHKPSGSTDKLYEITPDLQSIVRPESIGGTSANRMIHRESQQLFIGPYAIDGQRNVRVIPYSRMMGRHTGNARHLVDPVNKIYYGTMEEGFYEVDVRTLEVTELYTDNQVKEGRLAHLPGAHGKGLYSGQGRLVYANNGEQGEEALRNPFVTSGVLTEWDGQHWNTVLRAQFTEVTGPGGIHGNPRPDGDPVWSIGWDARSLILMVLDDGTWHRYRLPKASHSYDGGHGWNTEWPRIRDVGEEALLMTMHGMLWRFPRTFRADNSVGLVARSTYLKVVGDFCGWQDHVVFGCDDTARSEFLNKRKAKGSIAAPQSQSNLWFVKPARLDHLGPVIGRGAVWLNDTILAGEPSDPYVFAGFVRRAVHLVTDRPATLTFEVDRKGVGEWTLLGEVVVDGYRWHEFDPSVEAAWIRVRSSQKLDRATAWFHYAPEPTFIPAAGDKFSGLAGVDDRAVTGGLIRAQDGNRRSLEFAAWNSDGPIGRYVLDGRMRLQPSGDESAYGALLQSAAIPSRQGVLEVDEASVVYTDDDGRRFRLPRHRDFRREGPLGFGRLCREVATERDLFNCHGTFFELPANNAGGFERVRPVATHNLRIQDYCSYRGLFVISGINLDEGESNRHLIRSEDGRTALWVGAIDDIWELGKPTGAGGPWLDTVVAANAASDPYLMTGYDRKLLELRSSQEATVTAEVDITGTGDWYTYQSFHLTPVQSVRHEFPRAFQAYWIRFRSDANTTATAQLTYL
jgi:hypothetical protein